MYASATITVLLRVWFLKVEISIQSNFQPGMKLEVANKHNPDTYWVATIITTCGQLLLLRYCGYGDDRRADFWCDVVIADLHPVGWCTQNNKALMPPDGEPRASGRQAGPRPSPQLVHVGRTMSRSCNWFSGKVELGFVSLGAPA